MASLLRHSKAPTLLSILVLATTLSLCQHQPTPAVTVDLVPLGMLAGGSCASSYFGYRAVRWLEDRVFVVFDTSSDCMSGTESSQIRLLIFDLQGHFVNKKDIPYDRGQKNFIPVLLNDGIWIGRVIPSSSKFQGPTLSTGLKFAVRFSC
jgi:hypothetical protein